MCDYNKVNFKKEIYTKELYELCTEHEKLQQTADDLKIFNIKRYLVSMKQYLLQVNLIPPPFENSFIKLSDRQFFTAKACSYAIADRDWNRAFREFMDCIDDYTCGQNPERIINYAEQLIYLLLINNFLSVLEQQNRRKENSMKVIMRKKLLKVLPKF